MDTARSISERRKVRKIFEKFMWHIYPIRRYVQTLSLRWVVIFTMYYDKDEQERVAKVLELYIENVYPNCKKTCSFSIKWIVEFAMYYNRYKQTYKLIEL